MIKLLHLVSSLDYCGAARKVLTLAAGLPRDRFEVCVAVLGGPAPWVETLRAAGITVDLLGWCRTIEVRPLLALRGVLRSFQPDVVHVWSRLALRSLAACGRGPRTRLFASNLLKPGHPLPFWDRLLARRAHGVVAFSAAEAGRYRRGGIPAALVSTIAPGIEAVETSNSSGIERLPKGRFVLGIGPLEMYKGFRDAVWALNILHYLYADLHLLLAGKGADGVRIAQFAQAVDAAERVHLLGPVADLSPLLQRAVAVWVPSRIQGGVGAALEAMAAARPVVATRTAGLDEIVVDGVTGFLVKPGDKAGLARQTRRFLDDPALADRMGAAGRQRVREHFPAARMVQECGRLYAGTARNPADTP